VTTHEQYNKHSHKIGLRITVLQWWHKDCTITTYIKWSYILLYHT